MSQRTYPRNVSVEKLPLLPITCIVEREVTPTCNMTNYEIYCRIHRRLLWRRSTAKTPGNGKEIFRSNNMYWRWSSPRYPRKRSLGVQILQKVLRRQNLQFTGKILSERYQKNLQASWITEEVEVWTKITAVGKSTFHPPVFAWTGCPSPSPFKVISKLAPKISEKGQGSYCDAKGYIRKKK